MKYIRFELQKLLGIRFLWIFLAVMLAVNGAVAWNTASRYAEFNAPADDFERLFNEYSNDPEGVTVYYKEYTARVEEQRQFYTEALNNGRDDYQPVAIQNKYSSKDSISDAMLFKVLFDQIKHINSYSDTVQEVIDRAKVNIDEAEYIGIETDSYFFKYQDRVLNMYENVRDNVKIGFEYTHGWGEYFAYEGVNLFIFAVLIMFGSVLFINEKSSGMLYLIKTTNNGRSKTAVAKIALLAVVTVVTVLMFSLSTWVIYDIQLGFGSAFNAIQAYPDFVYSPYIITVGQYFALTLAVKAVTFFAFAMLVALFGVMLYNYALTYLAGVGLFGLNFLFSLINYGVNDYPVKYLNLVSFASVNTLFQRYRAVNIFGAVCGYISFFCIVIAALIAAACIGMLFAYRGRSDTSAKIGVFSLKKPVLSRVKELFDFEIFGVSKSVGSANPFFAELYKLLVSSGMFFLIIVLLAVKLNTSFEASRYPDTFGEYVYKEYMTVLEGELTDEKRRYIADTRAEINEVIAQKPEMDRAYKNGVMTYDEYTEYLERYYEADSRRVYFKDIEEHAAYIDKVAREKGISAHFVYDTGWKKLFNTPLDITIYVLVLMTVSGVFVREYASKTSSNSFSCILRSTKKGRGQTFAAKLFAVVLIAFAAALIWCLIDIVNVAGSFDLPAPSSPALSVVQFSALDSNISLLELAVTVYCLRVIGAVLLAVFVFVLSQLLKKTLSVLSAASAVTLLPHLLAVIGIKAFEKLDYTGLMMGTPLVLLSAEGYMDAVLLAVFVAVCVSVCAVGVYASGRKWIK